MMMWPWPPPPMLPHETFSIWSFSSFLWCSFRTSWIWRAQALSLSPVLAAQLAWILAIFWSSAVVFHASLSSGVWLSGVQAAFSSAVMLPKTSRRWVLSSLVKLRAREKMLLCFSPSECLVSLLEAWVSLATSQTFEKKNYRYIKWDEFIFHLDMNAYHNCSHADDQDENGEFIHFFLKLAVVSDGILESKCLCRDHLIHWAFIRNLKLVNWYLIGHDVLNGFSLQSNPRES